MFGELSDDVGIYQSFKPLDFSFQIIFLAVEFLCLIKVNHLLVFDQFVNVGFNSPLFQLQFTKFNLQVVDRSCVCHKFAP